MQTRCTSSSRTALGVVEYWVGHVALGRPSERDRPGEFRAKGRVADIMPKVGAAKARLRSDAEHLHLPDLCVNPPESGYDSPRADLTRGAALFHVLEELAQHHGQMEITRDLLLNNPPGATV